MNRLSQVLDANGNSVGTNHSACVDAQVFTTAEVHTIPTGAKSVRLTGTIPFWMNIGAAAAIPSAEVADGTSSILVLTERLYAIPAGVTTIGLVASAACVVSMEFYT